MATRPKRKRTANILLTKQELQEYLDDGYTPATIAGNLKVSPGDIQEKIRKFGIKWPDKAKEAARCRVQIADSPRGKTAGSPRGLGPRSISLPKKTVRGHDVQVKSEQPQEENSTLERVLAQVIEDNPDKFAEDIHSIIKSMGFDFDSDKVAAHLEKLRRTQSPDSEASPPGIAPQTSSEPEPEGTRRRRGRPRKKPVGGRASRVENVGESHNVTEGKGDGRGTIGTPKSDEDNPDLKGGPAVAATVGNREGPEASNQEGEEASATTPRGPEPSRISGDSSGAVAEMGACGEESVDPSQGTESATTAGGKAGPIVKIEPVDEELEQETKKDKKPRKRGRPRLKSRCDQNGKRGRGRIGRPPINLSVENLKHCVDSGLTSSRIAAVFGTCQRSVSRYLGFHKMRKSDRFSNMPVDEMDAMVSKICIDHPDWGQLAIQKHLAEKGHHFRRCQVRSSVKRVDPVGIGLRKLRNLKRRWNRGSLKTLDRVLPADGISMTSTASFLSQPPRTGLNGLDEVDSVRLLREVISGGKKQDMEGVKGSRGSNGMVISGTPASGMGPGLDKSGPDGLSDHLDVGSENGAPETVPVDSDRGEPMLRGGLADSPPVTSTDEILIGDLSPANSQDEYFKSRLQNIVNKGLGRGVATESRGPAVDIPFEKLQQCVTMGFSSTRIADCFQTNKDNVRKHLDLYRLGKASRFEKISEDDLDDLVVGVMREHNVLSGREVYDKVHEKGLQIRREDIRKSLCRLHPKGLHRGSLEVIHGDWREARRARQCVDGTTRHATLEGALSERQDEEVIVMDTADLEKLLSASDMNLVIVNEKGHEVFNSQTQATNESSLQVELGKNNDVVGVMGGEQHGADAGVSDEAGYKPVQGTALDNTKHRLEVSQSQGNLCRATSEENVWRQGTQHTTSGHFDSTRVSGATGGVFLDERTGAIQGSPISVSGYQHIHEHQTPVSQAGDTVLEEQSGEDMAMELCAGQMGIHNYAAAANSQMMGAQRDHQTIWVKHSSTNEAVDATTSSVRDPEPGDGKANQGSLPQEETSAIELDFNVPQGESPGGQSLEEVVSVEGGSKEEMAMGADHIILQLTDDTTTTSPPSTSRGSGGTELTSLNTVQASDLSAQVLLQLNRIAQNLGGRQPATLGDAVTHTPSVGSNATEVCEPQMSAPSC